MRKYLRLRDRAKQIALALCLFALGAPSAIAQTTEEPPAPDPAAIIAPNHKPGFYVFATGEGIWFSTDLVEWAYSGQVFSQLPQWARSFVPGATSYWAPDITLYRGLYYLYYAVSTFGSQRSAIGLAVNQTIDPSDPTYNWQDRGMVIESTSIPFGPNFNAIDPHLVIDKDRQWFLFFGSYWSGIKFIRLDPRNGKPFRDSRIEPVAKRAPEVSPDAIEGAYVFRHRDFYYLFVSWDMCCAGLASTYKVAVGRSRSVAGPYVDRKGVKMLDGGGAIILKSNSRWIGPGGNSVLHTSGEDYIFYHAYDAENLSLGEVLRVSPISWSSDWWPVVGPPLQ